MSVFSVFRINEYYTPKMVYYEFYKTSLNGWFLNCCLLVHLANYVKL